MTISSVLLNVGYVTFVLSPAIRNEFRLRAVMIAASMLFVTWGVIEGLWNSVAWNVLFVSMNILQFAVSQRRQHRSKGARSVDEMAPLFDVLPDDTSEVDGVTLFEAGRRRLVEDETLVLAGVTPHHLSLVLNGQVEVCADEPGDQVVSLGRGSLIGEMSYLTGAPPARSVKARGTVEVVEFPTAAIDALRIDSPTAHSALLAAMGRNLSAKIAGPSAARQVSNEGLATVSCRARVA